MSIPSNLLPINNPLREEIEEVPTTIDLPNVVGGVPNNLLPVTLVIYRHHFNRLRVRYQQ